MSGTSGPGGTAADTYHYSAAGAHTIDANAFAQPLGYLGAYTNYSTGLIHLGAKFYDPSLLVFTQVDPETHNSDPTQVNSYTYAGADPINSSDLSGAGIGIFLATWQRVQAWWLLSRTQSDLSRWELPWDSSRPELQQERPSRIAATGKTLLDQLPAP